MRYVVSPEFTAKLAALSAPDIQRVALFLADVSAAEGPEVLRARPSQINQLADGVAVARLGRVRVYFSLGSDKDGEYLLLLDATVQRAAFEPSQFFATKNPRLDAALNPALNAQINPQLNPQLNPTFNPSINPTFNSSLNPTFNTTINPVFNANINPTFNSVINPLFNSSLNPKFNSSINPKMNPAFGGPYLYDLKLQTEGYTVRVNDDVELVFDCDGEHCGQFVRANENVRVHFNKANKWEGFVVRANDDVSLRFQVAGVWAGTVI